MNLLFIAILDGAYTAGLYLLRSSWSDEHSGVTVIVPLILYAFVGVLVGLRGPKWIGRTVVSVTLVSLFGYLFVGVFLATFEENFWPNLVLGVVISYFISLIMYCIIALISAHLTRLFLKHR